MARTHPPWVRDEGIDLNLAERENEGFHPESPGAVTQLRAGPQKSRPLSETFSFPFF